MILFCVLVGSVFSVVAGALALLGAREPFPEVFGRIGVLFLFYPVLYFFLSLGGG